MEETSNKTIETFLKVTKPIPTKGTMPKASKGLSRRYYTTMIKPEVNRHAQEKLRNLLLFLG